MINPTVDQYLTTALSQFDNATAVELKDVCYYAVALHSRQQLRPSGEAYENHVIRVAARIVNEFGVIDKMLFIAALLHDSVEDQLDVLVGKKDPTREEAYAILTQRYSPRVSGIVQALSNTEEYGATENREERNSLYISHVIQECEQSNDCFVIKLSDFFDNAMQLQKNITPESKVRGAIKYLPLFDYFIGVLSSERHLPFASNTRKSLFEKIKKQKEYVTDLLYIK